MGETIELSEYNNLENPIYISESESELSRFDRR